ncbi:hypothetical protein HPB50_004952 [Hyalomma asiaticum]|uniref:Uncharacterized protein n=1 Tax=Hyalomma asiaticum TaxID=266040 RepID=A0ACB7RUC1_HYAAI|nr:hypothetical protein HPB50_004952 [Hyalomma asiaticum]
MAPSGRTVVNIWGAMSRNGLSLLHRINRNLTAKKYENIMDFVLIPYVLEGPLLNGFYLFQHSLSPMHTAKRVKQLLRQRSVQLLEWLPKGAN